MRASFYQGSRTFTTGSAPITVPQAGEALVRVERVGICGTDLHIYQGHLDHRVPRGGVIGHEAFGEVVEAPAGVGVAAGDRVVVEPLWFCGACRACRMGATYQDRKSTRLNSSHSQISYAVFCLKKKN